MSKPQHFDQFVFTSQFEGVIKHLYKDHLGNITCGVGFRVYTVADVRKFFTNDKQAALDYKLLESLPTESAGAADVKNVCQARMLAETIHTQFDDHVELLRYYLRHPSNGAWLLERYPHDVQIVLVDIAYQVGAKGLSRFVKLRRALDQPTPDYVGASKECTTQNTQLSRNVARQHKILSMIEET